MPIAGGVVGRIQNVLFGGDEIGEEGLVSSKRDVIVCELGLYNAYGKDTKIVEMKCDIEANACEKSMGRQVGIPFIDLPKMGDKGYVMMIVGEQETKIINYDMAEEWSIKDTQTFNTAFCYGAERLDSYDVTFKNFNNQDEFINQKELTVSVLNR